MPNLYLYRNPDLLRKETKRELRNRLLLDILHHESGIPRTERIRIETGEYGKPYLADIKDICFNLSDSGDYMALAIGKNEIGIDIETIKSRPCRELLQRYFLPEERAYAETGTDFETILKRFIRLWTCKESLLKYIGCGLGAGMKSHPILFKGGQNAEEPQAYAVYRTEELHFHSWIVRENQFLRWNPDEARYGDAILTLCLPGDSGNIRKIILPPDLTLPTEMS